MNKQSSLKPHSWLAKQALQWFSQHGRKNLPWQQDQDPYKIWVSEIMLQQTQVKTVIPYFQRFLKKIPTVAVLAQAPQDLVMQLWAGLGYYSRARNLQHSAQIIMAKHQGRFPTTFADLIALPGIGRSTAGAILSSAFGTPAAILDGNVKRLLIRFHNLQGDPKSTMMQKQLWQLAEEHLPNHFARAYNQALMDLGALICTPQTPQCHSCPLQQGCQAYQKNALALLRPQKSRQKKSTKPTVIMPLILLLDPKQRVLLEKRPAKGIWGALWCLPEIQHRSELAVYCQQQRIKPISLLSAQTISHELTHRTLLLNIEIWRVEPLPSTKITKITTAKTKKSWHALHTNEPFLACPKPIEQLLQQLKGAQIHEHHFLQKTPKKSRSSR